MTQQECNINKIIKYLTELQRQLIEISPSKKATDKTDEQPSENIEEKRQSWWVCLRGNVQKIVKMKREASNHGSDSGGSQGGSKRNRQNSDEDQEDADLVIRKLQSDIDQMIAAFSNLSEFETNMSKWLESDLPSTKLSSILQKTDSIKSRSQDLNEIRRKVFTLKCQIPSLLNKQSSMLLSATDSQSAEEMNKIDESGNDINLPGLHVTKDFKYSIAFEEVVEIFQGLDLPQKLCLLSFAVFPENREVKRTMLMYWWIGEGFINSDDSENSVTSILDEFKTKKLLELVEDERKLESRSYRMEPHVHSAVIHLAESGDLFRLYNPNGKLTMEKSLKEKVCLVKGSSLLPEAKVSKMKPQHLTTVFNSSERYPDFTFKWFPSMKSLKVLYLGRWERTAERHIEVESTKFLKDMKALKNLRLASFQGISRIEKLEDSICALPELVILDLKACYNLEVLPDDIGLFKKLIYLDVSDCYMLDRMPKGIAKLTRLQVLKGFVISERDHENDCAVKRLVNLRKLSITVNKYSFTVESLMESLTDLKKLESLKIAWGARFSEDDQKGEKSKETNGAEKSRDTPLSSIQSKADDHREINEMQEKSEGVKKGSPPRESSDMIQKKLDGGEEKTQKSHKTFEFVKTESFSEKSKALIQKKPDDESKVAKERDGDKGKADQDEGKNSKSDKVVEGNEKTSPPQESKDTIQKEPDNRKGKNKVEEEGDANKGKADLEEVKKKDEAEKSKSEVVEGEKKGSTPRESSSMIQKKPDAESKVEKERDGDIGKVDQDEGKKQDEVEARNKVVEGNEKASPPQESKDTIQNKTGDKTKVGKEGDGDKGKADPKEETKHDEVDAGITKSDNGVDGVKKPSPSRDDHKQNGKVQEKGDGNKGNADLEEGKKKNEVKAESSKPDKVIKGDGKINPPQELEDTIQSKADDHGEISKVQEKKDDLKKLDGGEAKTQKSHKTIKFGKTESFSEKFKALIQKKPDDLKNDNSMAEEIHETESPSRKPRIRKAKMFMPLGNQTMIVNIPKLPSSLKKLELECFPEKDPPSWLEAKNLDNLEKLSIKGGKLSQISTERPTAGNRFSVKILRLKYLHEFKAEWKDLQALFPNMILLEKYECPKIAFCPTDGKGVWKKPNISPNM